MNTRQQAALGLAPILGIGIVVLLYVAFLVTAQQDIYRLSGERDTLRLVMHHLLTQVSDARRDAWQYQAERDMRPEVVYAPVVRRRVEPARAVPVFSRGFHARQGQY